MDEICDLKIINLLHRNDRREECIREGARAGMHITQENFFTGRYVQHNGALGCALSHAKVLADFLFKDDRPYILVLEDDFSFRDVEKFHSTINSLFQQASLWDVFLLGHNEALPIEETPIAQMCRVINSHTMSGYLVKREYASKLVECYFRSAEQLRRYAFLPENLRIPARSIFCCDVLWKELQNKDRFFASFPSLIYQRSSYSDIEKKLVDYGV